VEQYFPSINILPTDPPPGPFDHISIQSGRIPIILSLNGLPPIQDFPSLPRRPGAGLHALLEGLPRPREIAGRGI